MKARVKQSSRYGSITAFSGLEFVKTEWRVVPDGLDEEAKRNPYLELQGDEPEPEPSLDELRGVEQVDEPEVDEPEPKVEPPAKKKARKRKG